MRVSECVSRVIALLLLLAAAACSAPEITSPSPSASPQALPDNRWDLRLIAPDRSWVQLHAADVFLAPGMEPDGVEDILALVDREVWAIQDEFGLAFPVRPQVALFPDFATFAAAVPGGPPVDGVMAVAVGRANQTLIDVEAVRRSQPVTVLRHELSHLMLREITGQNPSLPRWFTEGLARLHEEKVEGFARVARQSSYAVLSRAKAGSLPTPGQLATPWQWGQGIQRAMEPGQGHLNPYSVAAEYMRLLRDDVGGDAGLRRMFARMDIRDRRSVQLEHAYRELSGRAFEDFTADAVQRLLQRAGPLPAAVIEEVSDASVLFIYGLPPDTVTTITIHPPGYRTLVAATGSGPAGLVQVRLPLGISSARVTVVAGATWELAAARPR